MTVQILGTGCAKCRQLAANAEAAVTALGLDARIEKIERLSEILKFGVMMTPALAINGTVKSAGRVLSPEEIGAHLRAVAGVPPAGRSNGAAGA
ncbi:MAG: thioredoxin family protein [Kiritimatiellae bacterium]|nr:thioredoxin family protein [Kiritimatiellia bacterium]